MHSRSIQRALGTIILIIISNWMFPLRPSARTLKRALFFSIVKIMWAREMVIKEPKATVVLGQAEKQHLCWQWAFSTSILNNWSFRRGSSVSFLLLSRDLISWGHNSVLLPYQPSLCSVEWNYPGWRCSGFSSWMSSFIHSSLSVDGTNTIHTNMPQIKRLT